MVILLKDQEGIGITPDLDLAKVQSLDLDTLHFAARIDISRWLSKDMEVKKNHISFLKGRSGNEEVVNYFKTFLGIDEHLYLDPARHTLDLVNTIKNYVAYNVPIQERDATVTRVYEYANDRRENDKPVLRNQIANLISPDDPENFVKISY